MARLVKCQRCGNKISSDMAFKNPINVEKTRFKYYCSEDEFNEAMKEEQIKLIEQDKYKSLMSFVLENLLGYEKGMIFPSSLVKRIQKLRGFYTYEIIRETFDQCKDNILWAINNKGFESEFGMTSYIMTIVESKINDVYKTQRIREEIEKRSAHKTINTAIMNDVEMDTQVVKKKEKESILSFLGDDEL